MRRINKNLLTITLAVVFVLSASMAAQAVQLRPAQGSEPGLRVDVRADKALFQVGEPIRFSVSGNQGFYLYVFGIDGHRTRGHLILPNRLEPDNFFRGGQVHTVPGQGVEFFGDRPGVEKVIFVASTRPIDLNTGQYTKSGNFLIAEPDTVEAQVKAIRVRPLNQAQQCSAEIRVTVR